MSSRTEERYHHGDLPAALRAATAELVAEKGPSGFSLREVARRAGVSHAAPAHHFGDAQGLLTSLAAEGFGHLADALHEAGVGVDDARDRLIRCGHAYVRTALTYPGHFAVIFHHDRVADDDPHCRTQSLRAYGELQETVAMIRDQLNPDLDVDRAATFCWAAIQGLVLLAPKLEHVAESTGTSTTSLDDLVASLANSMIDGLERR